MSTGPQPLGVGGSMARGACHRHRHRQSWPWGEPGRPLNSVHSLPRRATPPQGLARSLRSTSRRESAALSHRGYRRGSTRSAVKARHSFLRARQATRPGGTCSFHLQMGILRPAPATHSGPHSPRAAAPGSSTQPQTPGPGGGPRRHKQAPRRPRPARRSILGKR